MPIIELFLSQYFEESLWTTLIPTCLNGTTYMCAFDFIEVSLLFQYLQGMFL